MKRICVNCGSSPGAHGNYSNAARQLGKYLGENGYDLVYGGADVGLMGDVANAALKSGGMVTGVITKLLAEVKHSNLTELIVVETMHLRKMKMFELSDAFIVLPGGIGTLDEVFELLTWAQLGIHGKPVGLLNVENFFDKLLSFLDYAVDQRFLKKIHRDILIVEDNPEALVKKFKVYTAPVTDKWIDREHETVTQ